MKINLNNIRIGLDLLTNKFKFKKVPISISMMLTNRCNLNCAYCNITSVRSQEELSTQQVKQTINEFLDMGMRKIGFSGGEPLLRKDLGEIIRFARDKKLFISLTTNGTLLDDKMDFLKLVDVILISLDGPELVQEKTKSKRSKVNELLKNIQMLRNKGINVWTSSVLTKPTIQNMDYLIGVAKKYQVKILFQPLERDLVWSDTIDSEMVPTDDELKAAMRKVILLRKSTSYIANSLCYAKGVRDGAKFDQDNCLAGSRYCVVDPQGFVYPCFPALDKVKALNGVEHGFRKSFLEAPIYQCKGCYYPCHIEHYYLYALHPQSIINVFQNG